MRFEHNLNITVVNNNLKFFEMMKLTMIITLFFFLISCDQKSDNLPGEITVSGTVNKLNPGAKIFLEEMVGNSFNRIDETQVNGDQTYSFSFTISEPSFYRVNFFDKQYVNVILNKSNVVINADGDQSLGFAEVIGSTDTDYFSEVNKMNEEFQIEVQVINTQFASASRQGDVVLKFFYWNLMRIFTVKIWKLLS